MCKTFLVPKLQVGLCQIKKEMTTLTGRKLNINKIIRSEGTTVKQSISRDNQSRLVKGGSSGVSVKKCIGFYRSGTLELANVFVVD